MVSILMKGNEAIAEAAVLANCKFFAGYPITPQNEIPEYMSWRLPEVGGTFIQAESEISAINMLYGASGTGCRVMTSSSSPGISLKQEGISYMAATELPGVIVNMVRGGPGLGSISASQSDYFQSVKGGGHGDYRLITLAPSSVQEAYDLVQLAFDLADRYCNPVLILGDAMVGQMMEPVELRQPEIKKYDKPWAATGWDGKSRPRAVLNSLHIAADELDELNVRLQKKYSVIERNEVRYEQINTEDAEYIIVAYGSVARIAESAVLLAREYNLNVGIFRPISLWPFPYKALSSLATRKNVKAFICTEMSAGQMVEDVRLAVNGAKPVKFFGKSASIIASPKDIVEFVQSVAGKE